MDNNHLRKYLNDEHTPAERNAFEQEMQEDPFLMEAVEGLESFQQPEKLEAIQKELEEKIDVRSAPTKAGGKGTVHECVQTGSCGLHHRHCRVHQLAYFYEANGR